LTSFVLFFYNLLLPLLCLVYEPFYRRRLAKRREEYASGFPERRGRYAAEKMAALTALNRPIWIHAVSVGEVAAAVSLMRAWPDRDFVLSTTTNTGQAAARKKLPEGVVLIYFPWDHSRWLRRAFAAIDPALIVIMEVEIWPMLLCQAERAGIPVTLANGRVSDRSFCGFRKHAWLYRCLFAKFAAICAQTKDDAQRYIDSGALAERVHICNTMKFDQVPDSEGADMTALLEQAFPDIADPLLIVGASTHASEEALLVQAWQTLRAECASLRLVLVPRHVERMPEIAAELDALGVSYGTRSQGNSGDIFVMDSTGELMNLLACADIVFVGKSLAGNAGGHNIIEPAIFGKAILYGAAMDNFRDVAEIFQRDASAIELADDEALVCELRKLLAEPSAREQLGAAARATVEANRGAIARTIEHFEAIA
jgi:3-deoxy-D-manno-octulosonic-acid transferase